MEGTRFSPSLNDMNIDQKTKILSTIHTSNSSKRKDGRQALSLRNFCGICSRASLLLTVEGIRLSPSPAFTSDPLALLNVLHQQPHCGESTGGAALQPVLLVLARTYLAEKNLAYN